MCYEIDGVMKERGALILADGHNTDSENCRGVATISYFRQTWLIIGFFEYYAIIV